MVRVLALSVVLAVAGTARAAPDSRAKALAELLEPLLLPAAAGFAPGGWRSVEAARAVAWRPLPPIEAAGPSPEGDHFSRQGRANLAGRPVEVVASGARTRVFSYRVRDSAAPMAAAAIEAGFRDAGFALAPARCPIRPGMATNRRWWRLAYPGKRPAVLYAGPLGSGTGGYVLYLDGPPPMTAAEAVGFRDNCP